MPDYKNCRSASNEFMAYCRSLCWWGSSFVGFDCYVAVSFSSDRIPDVTETRMSIILHRDALRSAYILAHDVHGAPKPSCDTHSFRSICPTFTGMNRHCTIVSSAVLSRRPLLGLQLLLTAISASLILLYSKSAQITSLDLF